MSTWESPEVEAAQAAAVAQARQAPAMPADVRARLTARLAVETAAPGALDEGGPALADVTPLVRRSSPRRWLPAAAAVVVLAAIGTTVALTGGSSRRPGTAAGAGAAGDSTRRSSAAAAPSTITRSDAVLADVAGLDAHVRARVGAGAVLLPSPAAGEAYAAGAVAGTTGTDSGGGSGGGSAQAPAAAAVAPAVADQLVGGVAGCARRLDPDHPAVLVDEVVYAGSPALAFVFADDSPDTVSVYLVGPQCDAASAQGVKAFHEVRLG